MGIKIILKNEFTEIDDTNLMADILKSIAEELEQGLLCGYYENYEWEYTCKEI